MKPTTGLQPQAGFQGVGRLCRPSRSHLIFFECELAHTPQTDFRTILSRMGGWAPIDENVGGTLCINRCRIPGRQTMPWISAVIQSAFAGCLIVAASGMAIRNYCWTANRSSSFPARQRTAISLISMRVSRPYHQSGNMYGLECMTNIGPCRRLRVTYRMCLG
jgi:hypothetical protein